MERIPDMRGMLKNGIAGIIFVALLLSAAAEKAGEIRIIHAEYGADGKNVDVTEILQERAKNGDLVIQASNGIAGDPCYGRVKYLNVEYLFDGKTFKREVCEGQTLIIPEGYKPEKIDFPQIISFDPPHNSRDVEPGIQSIFVQFDRPMMGSHWFDGNRAPKFLKVQWLDEYTCEAQVFLEPKKYYGIWLNEKPRNTKFLSRDGIPAQKTYWSFRTGDKGPEEHLRDSLDEMGTALEFLKTAKDENQRAMALEAMKKAYGDSRKNLDILKEYLKVYQNPESHNSYFTYDPTNGTLSQSGGVWRVKQ